MDNYTDIAKNSGEDIGKNFVDLVIKDPVATVTLVLSFFVGYAFSFILFDYRNKKSKKSHFLFHLFIGLGYTALIFLIVNWKLVNCDITTSQLSKSMPYTFLIGLSVAFVIVVILSIIREIKKPY